MAKWGQLRHYTWQELSKIKLSWGNIEDFSNEQLLLLLKKSMRSKKRLSLENWISIVAIILEIAFRVLDSTSTSELERTLEVQAAQVESLSIINEVLLNELKLSDSTDEVLQLLQHTIQCLDDLGLVVDNPVGQAVEPMNPEDVIQNDDLCSDQSESE